MNIITKLALRRITSKKARSAVICAAILLTMVLYMTVVSIAVNIVSGYALMTRMASGTDYHGYLRGAAFSLSGTQLRDAARQSEDIADAVISSNAAQYAVHRDALPTSDDYIRAIEQESDLQHFYTDLIAGTFPETDTEILVNPLFFPDTKVGDTVGLYYILYHGDRAGTAYAEFTVSGMIQSRTDAQMQVVMRYSETLEELYGFSDRYLNIYFLFENDRNLTEKSDRLVNDTLAAYALDEYDVHSVLNQAYLQSSIKESLNPATVFLIVFSAAVVFLCSFLLIYNVYSIALTQDMHDVGLLNVIGTTRKQIRQMIVIQSLMLFTAVLPIGLIAGYCIGWRLLSPLLFSALSEEGLRFTFHWWIPLTAVVLTAFTLCWSATRPLKILNMLTPIAAVDYSPAADMPTRYVRTKNYARRNITPTPVRMAGYSVSRNRKKTVITALSMSVSVILFLLIATLCDYMVAYTESNLQYADYILTLDHTYQLQNADTQMTMIYDADGGVGMSADYCDAVRSSDYTDEVFFIRTAMIGVTTPQKARASLGVLRNTYPYFDSCPTLTQAMSGQLDLLIVSIPDELFGMIHLTENDRLGDGYTSGYAVYDGGKTAGITDADGNPGNFSYFEHGQTLTLDKNSYTILVSDAISPTVSITGWIDTTLYRAVLYLPEQAFLSEFGDGQIYAMLVNAKEDCYDFLRSDLTALGDGFSVTTDDTIAARYTAEAQQSGTAVMETLSFSAGIDGRMDHFDQMKQTLLSIQTVGYSLAAMIFLIGALNMVNTALSSVSERRREFAMLSAVGMTDRQMLRMLLTESMYSGISAVLMVVCVGFPLITLIIRTAMDALVSPHWMSAAVMLTVCMVLSMLCGAVLFRLTTSAAITDRIRTE